MVPTAPDAVSQVMNRGEDHIPGLAEYTNAADLLCHGGIVLTHAQRGVHQSPYIFLCFPADCPPRGNGTWCYSSLGAALGICPC